MALSRPAGAQLFVDDMPVGTTPLLMPGLSPGMHTVRLELAGFQTWSNSVEIKPGTRFRLDVTMEP